MRNIDVSSAELFLTNEVDEKIVFLYAGLIARHIEGIHRVVVADVTALLGNLKKVLPAESDAKTWHLVLEGNHRAVAHALQSTSVPCTVLENDEDLRLAKEFGNEGAMCHVVHEQSSFDKLVREGLRETKSMRDKRRIAEDYARAGVEDNSLDIRNLPSYLQRQILFK